MKDRESKRIIKTERKIEGGNNKEWEKDIEWKILIKRERESEK